MPEKDALLAIGELARRAEDAQRSLRPAALRPRQRPGLSRLQLAPLLRGVFSAILPACWCAITSSPVCDDSRRRQGGDDRFGRRRRRGTGRPGDRRRQRLHRPHRRAGGRGRSMGRGRAATGLRGGVPHRRPRRRPRSDVALPRRRRLRRSPGAGRRPRAGGLRAGAAGDGLAPAAAAGAADWRRVRRSPTAPRRRRFGRAGASGSPTSDRCGRSAGATCSRSTCAREPTAGRWRCSSRRRGRAWSWWRSRPPPGPGAAAGRRSGDRCRRPRAAVRFGEAFLRYGLYRPTGRPDPRLSGC